ncbi:MAG: hypothetical protein MUE72_09075 [Chitinophagaceae bacterium]|jgi:hypothetical protein|nr:hypothetical protein [Chitinophagaceae bacterium]MCU0383648.1 hypothetical protein [Cyclobacteriaceae bacterium]
MISNKKELFKFIDNILFEQGLKRKGEVWFKMFEEIIVIFTVGKSHQTGQFGHIFGGFIKEIMDPYQDIAKYELKHFYMTLSDYEPQIEVRATFNLSNESFSLNEREQKIENYIIKYVMPFFERVKSIELLKEEILKDRILRAHTKAIAMDFLGIPIGQ